MKILFDHNVPAKLRRFLVGHEIKTAAEMNWALEKDDALLLKAQSHSFELLITCDQNLTYQQNLSKSTLALLVLETNLWPILKENVASIIAVVNETRPGKVIWLGETWDR